MFEKEAEEYAKGLCKTCTFDTCRHNTLQTCAIKESLKQAFQQGAEFGYNKANEWHRQDTDDIVWWKEIVLPKESKK